MANYENITHNTIIECFDNYRTACTDAKNLLEDVNERLECKSAEKLGLVSYYNRIQLDLSFALKTLGCDPKNLLPAVRLINQTYENDQTLPKYELIQQFLDVQKETYRFAKQISECLDSLDMITIDNKRYNTMTATEEKNLPYVKDLKRRLSKMIREAGWEEIHVERGKKMSDYDERLLDITDAPARTSSDQPLIEELIIKDYDRGLRCKYTGGIHKRVGLFLDREDIENSI